MKILKIVTIIINVENAYLLLEMMIKKSLKHLMNY